MKTSRISALRDGDSRSASDLLLHELCAISSASGDLDGLTRVAERLAAELAAAASLRGTAGAERARRPQPVLVAGALDAERDVLLLVGHLDTVLPAVEPPRR